MSGTHIKRVILRIVVGALLPLVSLAAVQAQGKKGTQAERNKAAQEKAAAQQQRQQEHKAQRLQEARQKAANQQEGERQRKAARQQEAREKNGGPGARVEAAPQPAPTRVRVPERDTPRERVARPESPRERPGQRATRGGEDRLPRARQEQLIAQQRDRGTRYRQDLVRRERDGQERVRTLRQGSRQAQSRFQENYVQRLRQLRVTLESRRSYDYGNDPYFYTPPSVRYYRQGTYYETNQYGADLLRRAVDYGYEEGWRAGEADYEDNWDDGYEDSYAYRDANYGYGGEYVDQSEYNYYFREGFRRGYEDGLNRRYHYGRQANGKFELIASVLAQILSFQTLD
ncbi:MAG TPA: hypothetical protein VI669_11935 [Vicinamibacteria bacterium]